MGLPVYKGADLIAKCLDCLQRQTFGQFEAIISVDGNDTETAAACQPFLLDPRFRMVVHGERLDWVGNFNWLLQQDSQEFFCYRQHDDTTTPDFFEVLLQAADKEPNAAAIYCDCEWSGLRHFIESAHSIRGEPLDRVREFVERLPVVQGPAIRGLIRRDAIRQAGLVRSDEFRAPLQIHGWLAKLLRWGSFTRVDGPPLYYRLDRAQSFSREYDNAQQRGLWMWTTVFTALLDAIMPLCRTPDERRFFQETILSRIALYPYFRHNPDYFSSGKIIAACLERLKIEGNTHLLRLEELPQILQERIAEFEAETAERQRRIAELEAETAERQRRIYEVEGLLRERTREAERFASEAAAIRASTIWRSTASLRYLINKLR